jgi:hypothetical protein
VPGSVLWLLRHPAAAESRVRKEWASRGEAEWGVCCCCCCCCCCLPSEYTSPLLLLITTLTARLHQSSFTHTHTHTHHSQTRT